MGTIADIFKEKDLNKWAVALNKAKHIVLFTHVGPDGDTVGSVLGLASILRNMLPEACITTIVPDVPPRSLDFIPGADTLMAYEREPEKVIASIQQADMIGCIDFNTLKRLRYDEIIEAICANTGFRFMVDHHPYPEVEKFDLVFSYTPSSSTAELMFFLANAMGWKPFIKKEVAEAMLTGIITDTGCFMHNSSRPETFEAVGCLLALGADKEAVIDQLFHSDSESQLRLKGFVLQEKMTLLRDKHVAYITLNKEELASFQAQKGDTEGFVNMPLNIDGIRCSCLIREDADQIKISIRSTGEFAVNGIAQRAFGGGGHRNAAGAEYNGTVEEALALFLRELDNENENYNKQ